MKASATVEERLAALEAKQTIQVSKLSKSAGLAVIEAFRRSARVGAIADTAGVSRTNLYTAVGSWALRYCECVPVDGMKGRRA